MGVGNCLENVRVRELKLNRRGRDTMESREILERSRGDASLAEESLDRRRDGARARIVTRYGAQARRILKSAAKRGLQGVLDFSKRKTGFVSQVIAGLHVGVSVGIQGDRDAEEGDGLGVIIV
jgi:hypothetical protein